MIEILSNGSKWFGQSPDSIDCLKEVLKQHTLDPVFERYGDFINRKPRWGNPATEMKYKNCTLIFGNFLTYSHVFSIITDDCTLIDELEKLIDENKKSPEYIRERRLIKDSKKGNKDISYNPCKN